jgi:hypothetical protein
LWEQFLNAIHDANDVGARLPLNIEDNGRGSVHPGGLFHVLGIVNHVGDVG